MALKANTMSKQKVVEEPKVEVEKVISEEVKGEKAYKLVKDERGRLSIKILR